MRNPDIQNSGIPVIDPTSSDAVDAVSSACAKWGFFYVINHGVPVHLIERTWEETRSFFNLPRVRKLDLLRTRENPRGYYDRELTKNKRDLKEVFDFGAVPNPQLMESHPDNIDSINGYNQWPEGLPRFRSTMLEYFAACEGLGMRLLKLFCRGLGSPANRLQANFGPLHTSFVRLNYYPIDDPVDVEIAEQVTALGDMALHHHSDAGALTILLQDNVGGLQVNAGGRWWDVAPMEEALVINTADMMQVWSNDRYRAPLHRVLPVSDKARYSIPFFFNPSYRSDCAPLESLLVNDSPHYHPINWGLYRQRRTDGDYADYGKEIQLDEYRIHTGD